jgi:hypothetical protein
MPGRLFGLEFGRSSQLESSDGNSSTITIQPNKERINNNNNLNSSNNKNKIYNPSALASIAAEVRRPSMEHFKKTSFAKRQSGSRGHERSLSKDVHASGKDGQYAGSSKPVSLELIMESPPALMLDNPELSSGVLISGRLRVKPTEGPVTLAAIAMFLECTTTTKKPVVERCRACTTQVADLYQWQFLTKPRTFSSTLEELPFSHLVPGHLPCTTHGHVASIEYSLHVRARLDNGVEIEHRRDIVFQRALRPGNDKNSMRIFPPTKLTFHVTLPSVAHPIGELPVLFRLNGVTTKNPDGSQLRWRLRKIVWRIVEEEKTISPACPAHSAKVGGDGRGVAHDSDRDIGVGELKSGWKCDYTCVNHHHTSSASSSTPATSDGQIEGSFGVAIDHSSKPQCGVSAPNGTNITHSLVIELVISEEFVASSRATPAATGSARVLRTQFALRLTQRAGLGIAWDDETPPMYEDVPESPPQYAQGTRSRQFSVVGGNAANSNGNELPPAFEDLDLLDALALSVEGLDDLGDMRRPDGQVASLNGA